eukprot:COSAG01_NODE_601_length_14954_cov_175.954359_9_plen_188_part_00
MICDDGAQATTPSPSTVSVAAELARHGRQPTSMGAGHCTRVTSWGWGAAADLVKLQFCPRPPLRPDSSLLVDARVDAGQPAAAVRGVGVSSRSASAARSGGIDASSTRLAATGGCDCHPSMALSLSPSPRLAPDATCGRAGVCVQACRRDCADTERAAPRPRAAAPPMPRASSPAAGSRGRAAVAAR